MPQPIKGRKRRQRLCVHIHTIQTLMRSLGASARPAGFLESSAGTLIRG